MALIALGIALRIRDLAYPPSFQFDEHHFVDSARGYLARQVDVNDHPPLGKLLIAASIKVFGDTPLGFRLPALLSGLATLALGALGAGRWFRSRRAALFAMALLGADGFLISYSHLAVLDGFLGAASAATVWLAGSEPSIGWGVAVGLLLGFAASIKFSGVVILLPLGVSLIIRALRGQRREPPFTATRAEPGVGLIVAACGLALVIGASVYVGCYAFGLWRTGQQDGVGAIVADTLRLLWHHAELTEMKNPSTSGWVTWFVPVRPLILGYSESRQAVRALTSLGNLAVWWGACATAVTTTAVIVYRGWRPLVAGDPAQPAREGRRSRSPRTVDVAADFATHHGAAVSVILLTAVGFLAPWVLTHRDSYIYHFLPAYVPLVVLLAGFLSHAQPQFPRRVFGFFVAVSLVATFYAPVWSYLPITRTAMRLRLFLPTWR